MSSMKLWRCPKCKQEVRALADAVSHRCPSNKNLSTPWEMIDDEK